MIGLNSYQLKIKKRKKHEHNTIRKNEIWKRFYCRP